MYVCIIFMYECIYVSIKCMDVSYGDMYVYMYWFGLVWFGGFYGISTFAGYLTPNPFLCK